MSDYGGCVRAQVARLQGFSTVDPPAVVQGYFQRGHEHEQACLEAMRADGWDIGGEQALVVIQGAVPLVGHLDGGGNTDTIRRSVIEAKAPGAWTRFRDAYLRRDFTDPLMHKYAWQTSGYAHEMKMEVVVCCWDEENGVRYFIIEKPVYTLDEIHARVDEIVQAGRSGELPSCTQRDFPCPTLYLCDHAADERVTLDDPELAATLRRYQELTTTIRAGEQAEKDRKKLKTDLPLGRYEVEGIPLTVFSSKGRRYISEDALREDGLDPEKYQREGQPSIRWKVGE